MQTGIMGIHLTFRLSPNTIILWRQYVGNFFYPLQRANCHLWKTLLYSKIWERFSWQTPSWGKFLQINLCSVCCSSSLFQSGVKWEKRVPLSKILENILEYITIEGERGACLRKILKGCWPSSLSTWGVRWLRYPLSLGPNRSWTSRRS